MASVAQYYCDYVEAHNLQQFFFDHSVTTEVTLCSTKSLPDNCDNLPPDIISREEEDRNFRRHTISEIPVCRAIRKRYMSFQQFLIKILVVIRIPSLIINFLIFLNPTEISRYIKSRDTTSIKPRILSSPFLT